MKVDKQHEGLCIALSLIRPASFTMNFQHMQRKQLTVTARNHTYRQR